MSEREQDPADMGPGAADHVLRLQRLTRMYAAVIRCHRAIAQGGDLATVGAQVAAACVEAGHAQVASVAAVDDRRVTMLASAGPAAELGLSTGFELDDPAFAQTASAAAIRTGRFQIVDDYLADLRAVAYRDFASRTGVRGLGVFPLLHQGRVTGLLWLHVTTPHWFDAPLIELLTELAADLSFAMQNHQREQARAAAEQLAREGLDRFKRLFHSAPVPMMLRRYPRGEIVDLNDRAQELLGLARESVIGQLLPAGVGTPADEAVGLFAAIEQAGRVQDRPGRVRNAAGQWRDLLVNAERIHVDGVELLLVAGIDITERLQSERRLADSERRLAGIVETASDAIITVDREQHIRVFNRAAELMFGLDKREALGLPLAQLIPALQRGSYRKLLDAFGADTGQQVQQVAPRGDLWALRADGTEFPIEAAVSRLGEGDELLMTTVVRDLTAAREARLAREAQIAAEAANRAKTDFVANLGHELRTPLGAMLGATELMRLNAAALPEETQGHLRLLQVGGQHLLGLMDDLLDIARIDAGRLRVDITPLRLWPVLQTVAELSGAQVVVAGLRFTLSEEPEPAPWVLADAARLRQVLLNLVSNAAKYNRRDGWIRLSAQAEGEQICIQVHDGGLGMSAEQQARLFQRFDRLGREQGAVQGTGIGLALSRELMTAMGGDLVLESRPGEGTCVSVRLPRTGAGPAGSGALHLSGRVLYIEDEPINTMLVEETLRDHPGVQLTLAGSAAEGLRFAASQPFDLVLLDMQLPDAHGLSVLRKLQADPATAAVPVVVLSATVNVEDERAALNAGARAWWLKPLDLGTFAARLLPWLGKGASS